MDYLQPDFYRFNEDSLKLVKFITAKKIKANSILDAGAGCGIIGIELAKNINANEVHFLEVQQEFASYIEKNVELFLNDKIHSITIAAFSQYRVDKYFDLIVSNPPYYLPGKGQPNKDVRKGICRSFQIDSWKDLLILFKTHLASDGEAWVVIKNDDHIIKVISSELIDNSLRMDQFSFDDLYFLKFTLKTGCKY